MENLFSTRNSNFKSKKQIIETLDVEQLISINGDQFEFKTQTQD